MSAAAESRSSARSMNACGSVGNFRTGRIICMVSTCDVSIPISRLYISKKLRIMKPAPARSTSVSASCATMRPLAQRRARIPVEPLRPPLERLVDVRARDVKRRRETKQDAGDDADAEEECERPPVHREDHPKGPANVLQFRVEPADAGHGEQQAERAGDEREHALGQQLPGDLPAAGADRDAHAHLIPPPARASSRLATLEQAISRTADRAPAAPEQQPDLPSDDQTLERIGIRRELLVGVGILAGECAADRASSARACSIVTPPEPSDDEVIPRLPRLLAQRGGNCDMGSQSLLRESSPCGADPDHRRGDAIETDLSPQHIPFASPASCCHTALDSITTGGPPGTSSSGPKSRPRIGVMPIIL